MKKILLIAVILLLGAIAYKTYDNHVFKQRLDKMNARVKKFHSEGCTWEESRKMGAIEAGFVPTDSTYKFLNKNKN